MFKRIVGIAFIAGVCLSLAACGFQLETSNNLPKQLQRIHLTGNTPLSNFMQNLRQELASSGVQVVDSSLPAPFTLEVSSPMLATSLTSLSTSQQTRDYTITYSATFSIENSKGVVVVPNFTLSSSTTQTMFSGQLLSNSSQLTITKQELERELVTQLMYRLSSTDTSNALKGH